MDDDATMLIQAPNWVRPPWSTDCETGMTHYSTIPSRCFPPKSAIYRCQNTTLKGGMNTREGPPRPARRLFDWTVVLAIDVLSSRSKVAIRRSNARLFF